MVTQLAMSQGSQRLQNKLPMDGQIKLATQLAISQENQKLQNKPQVPLKRMRHRCRVNVTDVACKFQGRDFKRYQTQNYVSVALKKGLKGREIGEP